MPRPHAALRSRALLFAAAFAVLLACGSSEPPKPPPLEIPTLELVARDQPISIEMVGETSGSADIPIRARVEGVLVEMPFAEGGLVEKDELLYVIDPSELQSKVVEARGNLAEAQTRLAKAKADLDRIRPLAEMNAVSQVDLDGAKAQYEAALGSKQAARARLEQAEIELGYTKIRSPIAGRVGISEAKVGEFVGREPNPVVLNFVSKTDPIRVRFAIDERRYLMIARRIREAEQAGEDLSESEGTLELILADDSVHPHRGRMVARAASVDPETGTFSIEADFPNPDELVLAGQFAKIRAVVATREDAVLVPQRSINELQGLFRVYTVDDEGQVELRPVELGPKLGSLQIVDSGLAAGDRVALDIMRLQPGMVVDPQPVTLDESGAVVTPAAVGSDAEAEPPAKDDVGA